MKYGSFNLPYNKRGDDLSECINRTNDVKSALELHAQTLEYSAYLLRKLQFYADKIDILAEGNHITISCDNNIFQQLILDGLVVQEPDCEACEQYCGG